jgi:hypothetical protein
MTTNAIIQWTSAAALGAAFVCGSAGTVPAAAVTSGAKESCERLAGLKIDAGAISLPTSGAEVTDATFVDAARADNSNGEFCQVRGAIDPVDRNAPKILWQVNLPTHWNRKALQMGGGGYNGSIPDTLTKPTLGLDTVPTPLAQGYMTFASDSGHQAPNADDASFGMNDEAMLNYGYMHIKKTLDVARHLTQSRYGSTPRRVYFSGGSTGGREGLTAAMRWPETYDGILTNYPTASFVGLRLWGAALARAVYDDNSAGWIPPGLVNRIAADAVAACDALDGAADGLVSNPEACRGRADAFIEGLRCKNGETGHPEHCLTTAQIERTINVYHEGYSLPYKLADGIDDYQGYNSLEGITMQLGSQPAYREPPVSGPNAHHSSRAHEFMQSFVARRDDFSLLGFDIRNPGPLKDRIVHLSEQIGATKSDWESFRARGGKIIWVQGNDDPSVSPYVNANLYKSVVARMGEEMVDGFMRFYLIPGLAHGGGKFSPTWDNLTALDNWVENGVPPAAPIVVDATKTATKGRTRPLCEYPTWPKYKGSGDINSASSFSCASE